MMTLSAQQNFIIRNISNVFHPLGKYPPSKGATAARMYDLTVRRNRQCFYRSWQAEKHLGGMIVFPAGNAITLEQDILAWLTFFGRNNSCQVARGFGGQYPLQDCVFNDCSVTVDLWNISWAEVTQTAANLQKNYGLKSVLIKDFATGDIWLSQEEK